MGTDVKDGINMVTPLDDADLNSLHLDETNAAYCQCAG
jgi:hypothetical protein